MTAALPLRVVEGASKFIEGASLYKTFTIGPSPVRKQARLASLEEMHSPFGGTITRAYCRAAYEERPRGVLFCPLNRGQSGAARIGGGGERSEPVSRMLIMPYDTESKSRNADFILIAREGDTTTLGPKGRQT